MRVQMNARAVALIAALLPFASAQKVEYFYTETVDLCQINGASMPANEETTHGGVCAYRNDVARVYACPAPDKKCWTWYESCTDSGVGQTVCNRDGSVWCCNAVAGETCTTAQGQINVCVSNFTSPNSGVSIDEANQVYLAAIGVSNVTATSQSTAPTPFSTRDLAATDSASPTTTGSDTTTTLPSTSATATGTSSPNNDPVVSESSGSSLSGGAIAGIVVGAVAALAIIGAALFLLRRRRRNKSQAMTDPKYEGMSGMPGNGAGAYRDTDEKLRYGGPEYAVNELSNQGNERVEMPVSQPYGQSPARHEMP